MCSSMCFADERLSSVELRDRNDLPSKRSWNGSVIDQLFKMILELSGRIEITGERIDHISKQ